MAGNALGILQMSCFCESFVSNIHKENQMLSGKKGHLMDKVAQPLPLRDPFMAPAIYEDGS